MTRASAQPHARTRACLAIACIAAFSGCRYGEMHDQPRFEPYEPTSFFRDGLSSRPLEPGTVPRPTSPLASAAELRIFETGRDASGAFVNSLPFPLDRAVLERGQGRYQIFCTPCHGVDGAGRGPIVLRGFSQPPKLFEDKVRNQPIGYYFDVITHGHGVMYGYAARIPTRDRWTIAAFLRALQLSRAADPASLEDSDRQAIQNSHSRDSSPAEEPHS